MTAANEEILTLNQTTTAMVTPDNHAAQPVACDRWYIFRYKVMTKAIREHFQKYSDDIYFPWRKERKVRELPPQPAMRKGRRLKYTVTPTKIEYVEQPCIPGYIFVHAPIDDAIAMCQTVDINPWKKRYQDLTQNVSTKKSDLYYSVAHKAMLRFIDAVSHFQEGIRIYDPSEIDPEENDLVEFISGDFAGHQGYIKTQERKEGGIIIIPLLDESPNTQHPTPTSNAATVPDAAASGLLLHYGVKATPDQYRIIRFANPVRNNNIIKRTNQKVKELLQHYAEGKITDEEQTKRLRGYATRYEGAEMTTDIQRANLALLLYRIYTILEDADKRAAITQQINNSIIPAFDQHIANETGKRKAKVTAKKARFNKEKEEIDNALRQRHIKISSQQSEHATHVTDQE